MLTFLSSVSISRISAFFGVILLPFILKSAECRVVDYGAINDNKPLNTEAIQQAIDSCCEHGGGKVVFDGGGVVFYWNHLFEKLRHYAYCKWNNASGEVLLILIMLLILIKTCIAMDRGLIFAKNAESIQFERIMGY